MQNQTTLVPSLSFVNIGSEKIDTETLESYLHDVHHGQLFDSLDPTTHFNYNTPGVLPSPGMPLLNYDYKMMASPPMNIFNIPFGITKADENFSNQVQFVQPLPDIDGRQGNFGTGFVTPAYTPQSQHLDLNVDVLSFPISSEVPEEVSSRKSKLKAPRQRRLKLSNGDREFECPVDACGRKFKRSEHLKRHMRSHNGEKPYPCEQCGKRFSRSDNLKQHMKIHRKKGHFSGTDSSVTTAVTTLIDPSYRE